MWAAEDASLHFAVDGDTVTIVDTMAGHRGENILMLDGREREAHGYRIMATQNRPDAIDVAAIQGSRIVSRIHYEVSKDGATLTVRSLTAAHDGYPASEQKRVFTRA